jgi:hypothetical protein
MRAMTAERTAMFPPCAITSLLPPTPIVSRTFPLSTTDKGP